MSSCLKTYGSLFTCNSGSAEVDSGGAGHGAALRSDRDSIYKHQAKRRCIAYKDWSLVFHRRRLLVRLDVPVSVQVMVAVMLELVLFCLEGRVVRRDEGIVSRVWVLVVQKHRLEEVEMAAEKR